MSASRKKPGRLTLAENLSKLMPAIRDRKKSGRPTLAENIAKLMPPSPYSGT